MNKTNPPDDVIKNAAQLLFDWLATYQNDGKTIAQNVVERGEVQCDADYAKAREFNLTKIMQLPGINGSIVNVSMLVRLVATSRTPLIDDE